jgi:ATP-dependent Lon protease
MLDEVDKIGRDFRGDPAAALLEVLDQEQNHAFLDHYLDIPFDLSKVLFITTANMTATIPPALYDRMEIISLPGYVDEEKVEIAERFLIPRQQVENGLEGVKINFSKKAVLKIVREYTFEAGVRELERKIGGIFRKIAKEIALNGVPKNPLKITFFDIEKFLGPPIYLTTQWGGELEPGTALALAWTPSGGELLMIEVIKVPGSGNLYLTGRIGEVMRESAETALSLVKAKSQELEVDYRVFKEYDIHIHVPVGEVAKDGPSAGLAIFAALFSLVLNKPISPNLAMTGEVTLRGRVLRVGGIKEKLIGAYRGKIKRVVIPERNKSDLREVPSRILNKLEVLTITNVDEMIPILFPEKAHARAS